MMPSAGAHYYNKLELLIPNKQFITSDVINWTQTDKMNRVVITVGVAYGSDVDRAMALIDVWHGLGHLRRVTFIDSRKSKYLPVIVAALVLCKAYNSSTIIGLYRNENG